MTPPTAPTCRLSYQCKTDLNISAIPYHESNTLTWSAITSASGYRVYRSLDDNQHFEKVAEITNPATTIWKDKEGGYTAPGYLSFNAYYKATAYNAAGESSACAELYQEGYADACPSGANPDLTCPSPVVVSGITFGDGFKSGDPLTLSGASVKNDFRKTTVSPINSIYQVSKDGGTTYQDIADSVKSFTGGLTIGESKPVPSYQYATSPITSGGDQTLYFRAKADYDNRVSPEADENNNFCPASAPVTLKADFTVTLKADRTKVYQTRSVIFTPEATRAGQVIPAGEVAYSNAQCGGGGILSPTTLPASGVFSCAYPATSPLLTPVANSITGTYSGVQKSASASITVYPLKPLVKLYIVPVELGLKCMTLQLTRATILKGDRAALCWKVTADEPPL